jgi:hypothetical protein
MSDTEMTEDELLAEIAYEMYVETLIDLWKEETRGFA